MNSLQKKATELRSVLPKNGHASPPPMKGILLGTLDHKDGQIRIVWDEYEGRPYLSIRLWTTDDGKAFWPSKNGFTVKLKDIPTLADAISQALDLALKETASNPPTPRSSFEGTDLF